MSTFAVSVVIPARNTAATIASSLESIRAQTAPDWEVVVVDDGSTDGTGDVVERLAGDDGRIRLLSQPPTGVSAARNRGIEAARSPWLLFLDADDTVLPDLIARVKDVIAADPELDLVHVGCVTHFSDGSVFPFDAPAAGEDLFTRASQGCPFPIHSAVVRRDLVRELGAFDTTLRTSEDWDLWIRCGRAGARTSYVHDILSVYHMREGSASTRGGVVFDDGLRVVARVFQPDPRVRDPHPAYAPGWPAGNRARGEYRYASYAAGLIIAGGDDAAEALGRFPWSPCPTLTPVDVAIPTFIGLVLGTGRPPTRLAELWPEIRDGVTRLFEAIERSSGSPDFALRARRWLVTTMVDWAPSALGSGLDGTYDLDLDLETRRDLTPPPEAERVVCRLSYGGRSLPRVTVPIGYGPDLDAAVRDAVAGEVAWHVLAAYYGRETGEPDPVSGVLARVLTRRPAELATRAFGRWHKRGVEWLGRAILARRLLRDVFAAAPDPAWFPSEPDAIELLARPTRVSIPGGVRVSFAGRPVGRIDPRPGARLGVRGLRRAIGLRFADELASAVVDASIVCHEGPAGAGLIARARAAGPATGRRSAWPGAAFALESARTRADAFRFAAQRAFPALGRRAGRRAFTDRLPILTYHSVAPDGGSGGTQRFRVTPERFESHLRTLLDLGFHSVTLAEWRASLSGGRLLRGRPMLIVFDDGYADFEEHAWPLLQRYGLGATVFVVTDLVGKTSAWDRHLGFEAPLMGWDSIRELERLGVQFGSHSATHPPFGGLSASDVESEAARSLARLNDELAEPVAGLAYPYGDSSPTVRHIVRGEGYDVGFTIRPEWATPYTDRYDLPRIEIHGWDGPRELAIKLRLDPAELPGA